MCTKIAFAAMADIWIIARPHRISRWSHRRTAVLLEEGRDSEGFGGKELAEERRGGTERDLEGKELAEERRGKAWAS